ncbi:LemA family protein [Nonlabens xiamenensis]|uniref:LemA family protein n=1 Tax=Nonlabens xiamenensis TaxID=2341043 RepID=UPI000F610DF5|nr:LemA family protein [Nonlabens xiamenensis]
MSNLSKGSIIGIILGGISLVLLLMGVLWYNNTISLNEGVQGRWANVENSYQLRNNLIPNIVSTAKKYAEFEQETLIGMIEARSKATSINVDASNLTAENIAAYSKAQSAVNFGLDRLLATYENYPELKSNEQLKELINELERTEERINTERNRYNETVEVYNAKIGKFPGVFLAPAFGFEKAAYYEADEGADQAPDVGDLFEN